MQKRTSNRRLLLIKTLLTFVGGLIVLWFGTCVGDWTF
jgi:CrcB protein